MRFKPGSPHSIDSIRLSDLEAIYPAFSSIYQRHLRVARFNHALRRNGDFENQKLRLVSVRYLLGKHRNLRPGRRADIIQSLLGGNFSSAQRLLPSEERSSTVFGFLATTVGSLLTNPDNEQFKGKMMALSARLSDSQFLLELKDVDDKDLVLAIQEIEALTHSIVSSLIDKTVGNMTEEMVATQQEHCRRAINAQLKSEATKRRNESLVEFIRALNAQSARWRNP